MKYFILSAFIWMVSPLILNAQLIKGRVVDADNGHAVSFAIIGIQGSTKGISADIDGRFEWPFNTDQSLLLVQAIGYEKKTVTLQEATPGTEFLIRLVPAALNLLEVVVYPKENPANAIIREVIKRKPLFDPNEQKRYLCKSYSKTYFTVSDALGKEDFYLSDTARFREEKKFLEKQYLFFVESFSERRYKYKNIYQEKILASRVSGFKSAPFSSLASQLQSFTFYNDNIEILGIKYVNPLMAGTLKRYRFLIEDTIINQQDTTILIHFEPRPKSNFKGLKGTVYINKNQYALSNVIAEPASAEKKDNRISIQQLYARTDSTHWFPKQLNAEILFGGAAIGLGSGSSDKSQGNQGVLKCVSKTYVDDVVFDTIFKIRNRNVTVVNQNGYEKIPETEWLKLRRDTLNIKEQNTYHVLDSLGKATNIERKLALYKVLITGKIPLGYVDADLNRILKVNEYEGVRLGAGLSTSNKLSRWFTIGGFAGYGFRDKAWKYGGYAQLNYLGKPDRFLKVELFKDLTETAGTSFLIRQNELTMTEGIRDLFVTKMDKTGSGRVSLQHVFFNALKAQTYYSISERESPSGWLIPNTDGGILSYRNRFVTHETGIMLRWRPAEKFIESLGQTISIGSKWPTLFVNVAKGLTETYQTYTGQFDYTRIDLRIDGNWKFKVKGGMAYQLQAGKIWGDVPYTLRYNNKGSRSQSNRISVEKTFETMFLNEFISDEYAALFLSYNTGYILKRNPYCNPVLEFCHHYGIGNFTRGTGHMTFVELNDMSKGFSEAGLRIRNLYKSGFSSFGLAAFYRYGNYAYEETKRNLMLKLVLSIELE